MLQLVSIELKNFRAIEHGALDFDPMTMLIGENGCGISAIIEALSMTLDPGLKDKVPEFQDFHFRRKPADSEIVKTLFVNIRFQLSESEIPVDKEMLECFPRRTDKTTDKAALYEFTFSASLYSTGIHNRWYCKNIHDGSKSENPELLATLRLMIPVIHLKPGALIGMATSIVKENRYSMSERDRFKDLKERISRSAEEIILGQTIDSNQTVNTGFDAVKELATAISEETGRTRSGQGLALKLREMLQMLSVFQGGDLLSALDCLDQFTEKLGALMLVNALIQSTQDRLEPYSNPLLIIEQPEVFLHTKTLATIRILVNKIKAQKIITTHSDMLLGAAPFNAIRRIRKKEGQLVVNRVHAEGYSNEDLRRIAYHLKARHSKATFARFWIFVEGESEHWIIPQLARIMKLDFLQEGIAVIDFAQIGLKPLTKYASELGIDWHVLVDGDEAGLHYEEMASSIAEKHGVKNPVTKLSGIDIEHYFWEQGLNHIYIKWARATHVPADKLDPTRTIRKAIKNTSKPFLALSIVETIAARGSDAIPATLRRMILNCIEIARLN